MEGGRNRANIEAHDFPSHPDDWDAFVAGPFEDSFGGDAEVLGERLCANEIR